jgi:hypothetical protein
MHHPKITAFIVLTAISAFLLVVNAQNQNAQTQKRERKQLSLRAESPQISAGAQTNREIRRKPNLFRVPATQPAPPSERRAPAEGVLNPLAPPLGTTFDALNFNDNAATSGFYSIPPDPSGAAGPTHVVNVVNTTIEWYTKAGVMQNRQSLASFFTSLGPLTTTFDPKVIYDQYSARFIVTTMESTEVFDGDPDNTSRVFVAVSDNSDPNGTWYFTTLATEELISGLECWADFPGLAVDSEAIYYTHNMFTHFDQSPAGAFAGQRTWIIAKAPFYSGGAATATRFDTEAVANASPNGDDGGAVATTMQPTQMYGDTPGGVGTYLIAYSGINDGASLYVQVIRIDSPLSSPVFTPRFSLWGTIAADDSLTTFPGAPQSGTTRTIRTNDRRFSQNGVFRDGSLYCAAPIRRPAAAATDASQVTVHWFQIDPVVIDTTVSDPPPTDQGNVGGEDIAVGTYTFFPSVAVNCVGDLAIGFAASAPSIFPGSYYTARLAGDPAGTTQTAGTLRAGVDYYIRDFTTSMTVASRWGDYSGIWLDPSDEFTFWLFNEHALTRGTVFGSLPEEDGRWGTAWGNFSLPGSPCPLEFISAASRKKHGTGGTGANFNIYMPLSATLISATSGVECRNGGDSDGGGGGDYKIVLTFNLPVTGGTASVTGHNPGTASGIAGAPSFSGPEMIIPLSGVTNAQVLTVTASSVTDGTSTLPSVSVNVGFLIGDSTSNRAANASDVSQVKSHSGDPVDVTDFRTDLTHDNLIAAGDVSTAKSASGTACP